MFRRLKTDLIVLAGYAALSFGYFGWRLLPHPGRAILGLGHDPQIYIWSFAWWPHAISSWTNPFVTHALYAPTGTNVAWSPSTPGLALVFSPLTVLFGPVASFNVAALLLPALSAWTAYLLCRYLTRSLWASLVGGYLFGFSTATLRHQLLGHLNLTGVFLIPLVALVIVRYVRAELSAHGLAWRLGALLAFQLWISTEFALTLTLALVVGFLLAFCLLGDVRPRLRSSLIPIVTGYALAAILAAPLVVYTLIGFTPKFTGTGYGDSDLAGFVIPNGVIGIGGSSFPSLSSRIWRGDSAYLGLPTLLIIAALAVRAGRNAGTRFLVAVFLAFAVISLGSNLWVDGHRVIGLPWWSAADHVPGLNNAIAFRFAVYVSLAAAVIVAAWIETTKGRVFTRPYVLPALAVAALVPAVWQSSYPSFHPTDPERPAFFTHGLYKTCIPHNATVVTFPFVGDSMLWQAETGFWFRLASDGLQPFPKYGKPLSSFDADRIVWELQFVDFARPTIDRLLAFAATHRVDRVLSLPKDGYPNRAQMHSFGPTQLTGGLFVAPACGQPSLTKRNLASYVQAYREQLAHPGDIGYCLGTNFNLVPSGMVPAGILKDATPAIVVAGTGLTCPPAPAGYKHRGYATPEMGFPADTYPYYAP
jgi:hypothetical protein